MDDIVRRAMQKWPNVPAVSGWLGLNRRGHWLIRGERIGNSLLNRFIDRNYLKDDEGRWLFQNGPQRVFVGLAYTPWILRIAATGDFVTHTGMPVHHVESGWVDEEGAVILDTEHGVGLVDDRDVEFLSTRFTDSAGRALNDDALLEALERLQAGKDALLLLQYAGRSIPLHSISSADVPGRFGFIADPQYVVRETEK